MAEKIPSGYHTLTPFLMVNDGDRVIAFLKQAFGAEELSPPHRRPDGGVMHAALRIGDSPVWLGEASEHHPAMTNMLYVYVQDVDTVYRRAIEAGGTPIVEPAGQPWGDRAGAVRDPSGNPWWIATHVEDLTREELDRRFSAPQS